MGCREWARSRRRRDRFRLRRDDDGARRTRSTTRSARRWIRSRQLTDDTDRAFINPFLSDTAGALGSRAIGLSHPLGGCGMGSSAAEGVVDESGRVYETSSSGPRPFHEGLYIAGGARVPTALGVTHR